jgi:hypothetical protein
MLGCPIHPQHLADGWESKRSTGQTLALLSVILAGDLLLHRYAAFRNSLPVAVRFIAICCNTPNTLLQTK